ncbi:MAG TPA: lysophospholipid acyltransferase family protein [Acidimicrobiia bacterium]|nr:lysophospholipid acyltransferase family protein [Acidimicrobiia bacterium]
MWFYRAVRSLVGGGSHILFRARVKGQEHIPTQGGFVLASSHRSMMDIPFASWLTSRRLRYMGKQQLFSVPVLGSIFTALGGFPVARDGTDRKAVRDAMAMLHAGDALLMYPEGTRQHGPKIQPLEPGAAYLAMRAGVPIVPVAVAGTEEILRGHGTHLPRFGRVSVVIGEPLTPPALSKGVVPRDRVDALSAELQDRLQTLMDDAYALR